MKQIIKGMLSIALVVLLAALGFVIYGNINESARDRAQQRALEEVPELQELETPAPTPQGFTEPENAANIRISVCGDLVCHTGLNTQAAKSDGSYDYAPIFSGVIDLIKSADYAICTMETTFPETVEYSGYPMFKSPTDLAVSLKKSGFDMINTASNHCMDGLKGGLFRTMDVLDQNGLDHVGTYRSQEERDANNGILVKDIGGIKIAFLSYTYGTNAIPVTGFEYAANIFFKDYLTTLSDINYDLLKSDMAAARALDTDLIVVMPHWGVEYDTAPAAYQKELADFFFKEGADIVLGGHVHVPEPMELRRVVDNQGKEKTGFIVYCLGNFVSCQEDRYTNLTAVLNLEIQKNLDTGETYLRRVNYTPMYMVDLTDVGVSADWRYRLWNLQAAIKSYQDGEMLGVMNETLYNNMVQGLEDIHSIFGTQFDFAAGGVDVIKWTEENSEA